jgi:peptidoglycan/xylan/chitin deacetylase (PgdA/CDA1 family)
LAGCASKRVKEDQNIRGLTSYAPIKQSPHVVRRDKSKIEFPETPKSSPLARGELVVPTGNLAGRTIHAKSISDIRLRPGEVVLTFDDGPVPGKTKAILNTLDNFGVKATFLMVGSMVNSYPKEVKAVVNRGHSIGSHTVDHANLAKVSFESARAKIRAGEKTIKSKTGFSSVPFFRFPYLASTPKLRNWLEQRGVVVLDVDIDSKDYFKDSPTTVANRTIDRVKRNGSGIILFHDIHARTVAALPGFLQDLKAAGFKVVHLKGDTNKGERQLLVSNSS